VTCSSARLKVNRSNNPGSLSRKKRWWHAERRVLNAAHWERSATGCQFFKQKVVDRCFNCLANGHRVTHCPNRFRCWKCKALGHAPHICLRFREVQASSSQPSCRPVLSRFPPFPEPWTIGAPLALLWRPSEAAVAPPALVVAMARTVWWAPSTFLATHASARGWHTRLLVLLATWMIERRCWSTIPCWSRWRGRLASGHLKNSRRLSFISLGFGSTSFMIIEAIRIHSSSFFLTPTLMMWSLLLVTLWTGQLS
jgi:hypothetical protein